MALREVLARFGIEVESGKLKAADGQISQLTGKIREMAALVGAGALVNGFRSMIGEIVDFGGNINDTATKLGIGTSELQRWQFAAQQTGVGADALNASLTKFTRTIGEAADGNATAKDAFKALGLDVKDANGNVSSSTDLMLGAARGLSGIQDPAARAKAAIDLFGKSGADLIPLLGQGEEGVRAMLEEADRLGGVLNENTIAALDDAGDASDKFDFAMRGLKAQIAISVLPTLTSAGGKLAELVGAFARGEGASVHLKAALATLAGVAFALGVRAALPWIGWALIIAGLVLLVDDLWTGLNGGDSVTGRFLDRVFGKGAGASIFKSIREDATALWVRMREAGGVSEAVEEAFSQVGASIVRFFVEDIPAALDIVDQRIADGTASTGEKIIGGIRDGIKNSVVGIGGTLLEAARQAAISFIDGLVQGIKDGIVRVEGAVGELADAAVAKVKGVWKTGSPSRVTTELGQFFAQGPIVGVQKEQTNFARAVGDFGQAGVRALLPIGRGSGGPRTLNQTNSVNVTVAGTGAGAVKTGITSGLGEVGRAALEYLVPGVGG